MASKVFSWLKVCVSTVTSMRLIESVIAASALRKCAFMGTPFGDGCVDLHRNPAGVPANFVAWPMDGQITPRAPIVAAAQAAANNGQNVDVTNPYPAGTAAHALWERSYWAALGEVI